MDLKLSAAEQALEDELRGWLSVNYRFVDALQRTASGSSRDEGIWNGLVAGGWLARALPRPDDPQQAANDAAIIAEAFGEALVVEPFFRSAYLAAHLLTSAADSDRSAALVAAIGRGERRFAVALYEPTQRFRLRPVETRARRHDGCWRIDGRKAMVFDGADADTLVVSATSNEGTGLFLVARKADGCRAAAFHSIDDFACADITLSDVEAAPLAIGDHVDAAIAVAVDRVIPTLGAEVLGAAKAALDESARYAGERQQFGRPIAQFQVIAHRLARMFIELEALRGGVLEALSTATADDGARALAASGLKLLVGENGRFVVNQGIQVHGGVGTLNDRKVSHCFKRVFALETLYGNADFHLTRYADAMA